MGRKQRVKRARSTSHKSRERGSKAASAPKELGTLQPTAVTAVGAGHAQEVAPGRWLAHTGTLLWLLGLVAVFGFTLVLKMYSMHFYLGDEHTYSNQAWLIARGVTPYAEFAMAHPPLQKLFAALVYELFGFGLLTSRLIPFFWYLLGGLALALLVRRELGRLASLSSVAIYLLSYEPLRASSHFTGVNMTVALLLFAVLLYRKGWVRSAALICVAAVFTRLYAIPVVMVLSLWALIGNPRVAWRFILWGGLAGLAAFVALGWWAGFSNLIDNLLTYHAYKTPMAEGSLQNQNMTVLFHNASTVFFFVAGSAALVLTILEISLVQLRRSLARSRALREQVRLISAVLAVVGLSVLAWLSWFWLPADNSLRSLSYLLPLGCLWLAIEMRRSFEALSSDPFTSKVKPLSLPLLSMVVAWFFLGVVLQLDRMWMYYYIPVFPFAALLGGWMISHWMLGLWRLLRAKGRFSKVGLAPLSYLVGVGLLVSVGLGWARAHELERQLAYWERYADREDEERIRVYTWRSGYLPGFVDQLVYRNLWVEERVVGERYHRFNYLLWHESRTFDQLDDMVELIRAHSEPGDEIFGDSSSVPLLSLITGLPIAAHEVDTNIQRYRGEQAEIEDLICRIDQPTTRIIVAQTPHPRRRWRGMGVGGVSQLNLLLNAKYRRIGHFDTEQDRHLTVFERLGDAIPCEP